MYRCELLNSDGLHATALGVTHSDVISIDVIRISHSKFQEKRNSCMWICNAGRGTHIKLHTAEIHALALHLHHILYEYVQNITVCRGLTWKDIPVPILGLCSRWNIIHGYHVRRDILCNETQTEDGA